MSTDDHIVRFRRRTKQEADDYYLDHRNDIPADLLPLYDAVHAAMQSARSDLVGPAQLDEETTP